MKAIPKKLKIWLLSVLTIKEYIKIRKQIHTETAAAVGTEFKRREGFTPSIGSLLNWKHSKEGLQYWVEIFERTESGFIPVDNWFIRLVKRLIILIPFL